MQTHRDTERERERFQSLLLCFFFFCSVCTEGDEKRGGGFILLKILHLYLKGPLFLQYYMSKPFSFVSFTFYC
jgi:hypothetical protein